MNSRTQRRLEGVRDRQSKKKMGQAEQALAASVVTPMSASGAVSPASSAALSATGSPRGLGSVGKQVSFAGSRRASAVSPFSVTQGEDGTLFVGAGPAPGVDMDGKIAGRDVSGIVKAYANVVVDYSCLVFFGILIGMLLFAAIGPIVAVTGGFSIGQSGEGFEARGTAIAGPVIVAEDYIALGECDGDISLRPNGYSKSQIDELFDDDGGGDDGGDDGGGNDDAYDDAYTYDDDDDSNNIPDDDDGIYGCKFYTEKKKKQGNSRRLIGQDGQLLYGRDVFQERRRKHRLHNQHHSLESPAARRHVRRMQRTDREERKDYAEFLSTHPGVRYADAGGSLELLGPHRQRELEIAPNSTHAVPSFVDDCNRYDVEAGSTGQFTLVFEPAGTEDDLFTAKGLQAMHEVDEEIRAFSSGGVDFNPDVCRPVQGNVGGSPPEKGSDLYCCPTRSLCNYVVALTGAESCADITDQDVDNVKEFMDDCKPYYDDRALEGACWDYFAGTTDENCEDTADLDTNCTVFDAVYDVFHALTPTTYRDSSQFRDLEGGRFTVPTDWYDSSDWPIALWEDLLKDKVGKDLGGAQLVALDLDVHGDLFFSKMINDSYLIGILWVIVFFLVLLHSGDAFHTSFSFLQIFFAFTTAFSLYMGILQLFFPFLNMMCLFLLLGVGCDDVFVITDAFKQSFSILPQETEMSTRMAYVISRTGSAIFVTSFTTAASFLANATSAVTAIKCFGIFAALVTICDFVLAMLFLPVVLVLNDRYFRQRCCCCKCHMCSCFDVPELKGQQRWAERFFQDRVSLVVNKGRFVWIVLLLAYVAYMANEAQSLSRPTTEDMQLLPRQHPMEKYIFDWEDQFANEAGNEGFWPLIFIWGADDKDNGDPFDPYDLGQIKFRHIDGYDPEAWSYMNATCYDIYLSEWVNRNITPTVWDLVCPPIWLNQWMQVRCEDTRNDMYPDTGRWETPERNSTGCCNYTHDDFPYIRSELELCVPLWSDTYYDEVDTGVWYEGGGTDIKLLTLRIETQVVRTSLYKEIVDFFDSATKYSKQFLDNAPKALGKGFFTSDFKFFALQRAIVSGAISSTVLACALALTVIVCLTRDLVASLLAGTVIAGIVAVIGGVVSLDGWELNVIESVVFSLAVGLSCDFCAHLSHAYVSAPSDLTRSERVEHALTELGVSISMGCATTFAAGACLLNASVLFYQQFGLFLTTLMLNSLVLAIFLLMPLLAVFGFQSDPVLLCKRLFARLCGGTGGHEQKGKFPKNSQPTHGGPRPGSSPAPGLQRGAQFARRTQQPPPPDEESEGVELVS